MGFEYNFIINEQDLAQLSRWPDGINTVDKLLKSAPGFLQYDMPNLYSFAESNKSFDKWMPTVYATSGKLTLCIYSHAEGSFDMKLLNFLIYEILKRCGRLLIEDA